MIITIDGPAGVGKSTVAMEVAKKLNFSYLNSGAIYRTLTLAGIRKGINLKDENRVLNILDSIDMRFKELKTRKGFVFKSFLDGEDVSREIYSPQVSAGVSLVAKHPKIRARLLKYQRNFAKNKEVVCEGRDMGSRVFKNADIKIFLTAEPEIRAKRRYKEIKEKGLDIDFNTVYKNVLFRDSTDSKRKHAPLLAPEDAKKIDTSRKSVSEVVEEVVSYIHDVIRKRK